MSQNRLGKGLEALLGAARAIPLPERDPAKTVHHGVLELAVKQLAPGRYQPRRIMREAELETLADSIRSQGIIQPILVRKTGEDHYEIIAGERRWRAAQMAGLAKVPVVVKEVSDENAMAIALIENIQRENLSALEEALALERLSKEFNLTHQQVAEAVGKSRATISNLLRLLTLTEEVKVYLEQSRLEVGHAKVLLGLQGKAQREAAEVVVNKGLSVRETERLVEHLLQKVSDAGATTKTKSQQQIPRDPDVQRLENSLSEKLGASVEVVHGQNGKGRVIIQYNNLEELDGILAHIQ
ncbi:MAG TPA: ParB/RepB/Spo0J family partition protein [Gammaproteobacteria bacterium]|nr:ParB/RepB/Spo0J family partition protein [Gammaproteobacteria bacterium]